MRRTEQMVRYDYLVSVAKRLGQEIVVVNWSVRETGNQFGVALETTGHGWCALIRI